MRHYGNQFRDDTNNSLDSFKETVSSTSYGSSIANVETTTDVDYIKESAANVGYTADARITDIKDKIDTVKTLVSQFYDQIDETAYDIYNNAFNAELSVFYLNNALNNLTEALNGTGDYAGSAVSPSDIVAAGSPMSIADSKMQKYWEGYFTNSDGSFDETNVSRYFQTTDQMLADGHDNSYQTDCLVNLVDNYLEEHDYSDESYTDMLNMLTGCSLVYIDTSSWNPPDGFAEYGDVIRPLKVYGVQYNLYFRFPDSYRYFVDRAYLKMRMEYAMETESSGTIPNRAVLYDSMIALSSTGALCIPYFITQDEVDTWDQTSDIDHNLDAASRVLENPGFHITLNEDSNGQPYASLTFGTIPGPTSFHFADATYSPYITTEVDSMNIYSCCEGIFARAEDQQNESVIDMVESFRPDWLNFAGSSAFDIFTEIATAYEFELIPSPITLVFSLYLEGMEDLYDEIRISRFELDYNDLEKMKNFYSNSYASGSYWVVNPDGDSHTYASPYFFVRESNIELFLAYNYYATPTADSIMDPRSHSANEALQSTRISPNNPSISYEEFREQLNYYWIDYCRSQGCDNPPCEFDELSPEDIATLTYANREANQNAGVYDSYPDNGYVFGSYINNESTFLNCDIDINKYID